MKDWVNESEGRNKYADRLFSCFYDFWHHRQRERESGSGRDEEEHLISIVFMSHCRDSEWLRESKRTWARREEKDRARERASSALSRGQGRGKKRGWWTWEEKESRHRDTRTHTSHRLIASLSFHLSFYLPTVWVRLIQQDGSVRNNCCSIGKLCLSLYVCVSEVNNRTIPHNRIEQDSVQHTHWGIIHLFFWKVK